MNKWQEALERDGIFYTHYSELLIKLSLDKPKSVIDAGCGPGIHVMLMRELGINAVGIDKSPPEWTECEHIKTGTWLNVANESYDAVWSHHCLEHARDPILWLNEFARMTKTGSKLYLAVPRFRSDVLPGHIVNGWTVSQAIYLAALAGWNCTNYLAKQNNLNVLLIADRPDDYSISENDSWNYLLNVKNRLPANQNYKVGHIFPENW